MLRNLVALSVLLSLVCFMCACGSGNNCQTTAYGASPAGCVKGGGGGYNGGGDGGGIGATAEVVYSISVDNKLESYNMDASANFAQLSSVTPPNVPSGSLSGYGLLLVKDKFLYATYGMANDAKHYQIIPYTVGSDHKPVANGDPVVASGVPFVDPQQRFLFTTAFVNNASVITVYSIDQTTGLLSPTSTYTYQGPYGNATFDRTGNFLYVYDDWYDNTVHIFQLMGNGALSELQPYMTMPGITHLVPSPTADIMYGVRSTYDSTNKSWVAYKEIHAYNVDPYTGALTEVAGSPFPTSYPIWDLAVHPSGNFLYTDSKNGSSDTTSPMEGFALTASGSATALTSSPFTAVSYYPFLEPKFSPDGKYFFFSFGIPARVDPTTGKVTSIASFSNPENFLHIQVTTP